MLLTIFFIFLKILKKIIMLYTVLRKVTLDGKIIIIDSSNNMRELGKGDRLVKKKFKLLKILPIYLLQEIICTIE